jgi:hypothetical protein
MENKRQADGEQFENNDNYLSKLDFDDFRKHVNSVISKLEKNLVDHLESNMEDMDTKVSHVKKLVESKIRDIDHL